MYFWFIVFTINVYGIVEVYPHSIFASVLDVCERLSLGLGLYIAEKEPRYLLDRNIGGLQGKSGLFGEEERQCMCNVNLIRFHVTAVSMGKQ
jgi:hypothetical protein